MEIIEDESFNSRGKEKLRWDVYIILELRRRGLSIPMLIFPGTCHYREISAISWFETWRGNSKREGMIL
jgi:hypothetical protein